MEFKDEMELALGSTAGLMRLNNCDWSIAALMEEAASAGHTLPNVNLIDCSSPWDLVHDKKECKALSVISIPRYILPRPVSGSASQLPLTPPLSPESIVQLSKNPVVEEERTSMVFTVEETSETLNVTNPSTSEEIINVPDVAISSTSTRSSESIKVNAPIVAISSKIKTSTGSIRTRNVTENGRKREHSSSKTLAKVLPETIGNYARTVKVKNYKFEEYCQKCGQNENNSKSSQRWIFCQCCCEPFHLKCAADAPPVNCPSPSFVKPDTYTVWNWTCPSCRKCSKCDNKSTKIFSCFNCCKQICSSCLPLKEAPSTGNDSLFYCESCIIEDKVHCINACNSKIKLPVKSAYYTLNQLSCLQCKRRKEACPQCLRRYGSDEWDLQMICCDSCGSWTHLECTSITPEKYKTMNNKDIFHCCLCTENNKLIKNAVGRPQLANTETYRIGSKYLATGTGNSTTTLILNILFWSNFNEGQRRHYRIIITRKYNWILKYQGQWNVYSSFTSFVEAFQLIFRDTFRELYNFSRVNWDVLFMKDQILKIIQNSIIRPPSAAPVVKAPRIGRVDRVVRVSKAVQLSPPLPLPEIVLEGCARTRIHQKRPGPPQKIIEPVFSYPDRKKHELINALNGKRGNESTMYVQKSTIAGLGIFTSVLIERGEKIIEYTGEIIGQRLADRREKLYSLLPLRKHDCYLFRLDKNRIIDATLKSNLSRFFNHSCDPNCESQFKQEDGIKKIEIIAMRDIRPGEELTYDYKFSREEGEDEVKCYCGALDCRGYMT